MLILIPSFLTAFIISFFATPSIIRIAIAKNLCAEPGERHSHKTSIPTLGGLGIFAGLIFSIAYWIPFNYEESDLGPQHPYVQYLLCAFIVIFLIGAKDDIIPLTPSKKFMGQIFAAFLLVYKANIRLTGLYGILGIYEIPLWLSVVLSMFTILTIINALNLIDGINGLAGTIGCICCILLGFYFYKVARLDLAVISAAMTGSLVAFLYYNITPAKIFMGDTGSLLVGLTLSILVIKFIELNKSPNEIWAIDSVPAVAISILIIPLFDTLRVFAMRIAKGKSPFHPDRTHIHHLLLDSGLSHTQATILLGFVNVFFIAFAYTLQHVGTIPLSLMVLSIALGLSLLAQWTARRKKAIPANK